MRLSLVVGVAVTVDFETVDGTAEADSDYTAASGTLTFTVGETTRTISVPTLDDTVPELEEGFTVVLSNPSGAGLEDDTGAGTITDDDVPALAIDDAPAVVEGGTAEFVVRLSEASSLAVMVDFETVDGTAEADSDYTAASGRLTFAAGETTRTILVPTLDDTVPEAEEDFTVVLSNPLGARMDDDTGEGTIRDNELPELSIGNALVEEGETAQFEVRLSPAGAQTVTVDYATADDTAVAGADYTSESGTLTFPAGQTMMTIPVPTADDSEQESEERFTVVLSNPAGAGLNDDTGEGTITDNDGGPTMPELSIGNALVEEGETAEFEVRLIPAATQTVTVAYATAGDTAVEDSDYRATMGTLTFTAGQTMMTISVPTVDDSEQESEERFTVTLSNPAGARLNDDTGEGTIIDNDQPLELAIDDALPVVEGGTAEFVVRLSAVSGVAVTVDFETADGTAKAGDDYTSRSGTLTFTAGQLVQTISVPTLDDTVPELEEGFTVVLSNPSGARLNGDTGEGTIIDNDQPLELAIDDAPPVVEGGTAEFVVRLSAVSGVAVTVDFETVDGTAKAGSDYTAASGTLTFTAGQLVQTISVPTLDDTVPELEEGFTVVLSNPSGARLNGDTGEGTITDNDQPLELAIDDAPPVVEGGTAEFVVRLSAVSGVAVTVDFETADGTAVAGDDYTSRSGTLTFTAGQLVQTISVATLDDTIPEAEEGFTVVLSNPEGASLDDDTGKGTITDDDEPPRFRRRSRSWRSTTTPAVVERGHGGVRGTTERGERRGGDGGLRDGGRDGAEAGSDYTAASGRLSFQPGETAQSIEVAVLDDAISEAEEGFTVVLSNPEGASLDDDTGKGTITDDDEPPELAIDDAPAVVEGGTAEFPVRLSAVSGRLVTVSYRTVDGTALAGSDYTAASGTLSFPTRRDGPEHRGGCAERRNLGGGGGLHGGPEQPGGGQSGR